MRVLRGIYTHIPTVGAAGALCLILGVAVLAGVRASKANAAIDYTCTKVTNTIMGDRDPVQVGYQLHIVCADPNVTIIDPSNNSYLQFEAFNPLDSSWWLYDLKYVSKDYTNHGDFSWLWYDDCAPQGVASPTYQWRASAELTFHYEDGKWVHRSYTTSTRVLHCNPGIGGP